MCLCVNFIGWGAPPICWRTLNPLQQPAHKLCEMITLQSWHTSLSSWHWPLSLAIKPNYDHYLPVGAFNSVWSEVIVYKIHCHHENDLLKCWGMKSLAGESTADDFHCVSSSQLNALLLKLDHISSFPPISVYQAKFKIAVLSKIQHRPLWSRNTLNYGCRCCYLQVSKNTAGNYQSCFCSECIAEWGESELVHGKQWDSGFPASQVPGEG